MSKSRTKKSELPIGIIFTTFRRGDAEAIKKAVVKEYPVSAEVIRHETGGFAVKCAALPKKKLSA